MGKYLFFAVDKFGHISICDNILDGQITIKIEQDNIDRLREIINEMEKVLENEKY